MAEKEISIILRAKNAMAAGISGAVDSMKKVGETALNVGKIIATGFLAGTAALVGFASKALTAYAKQEQAEKSLVAAINAHGEAGDALLPMLKEIAARIQDQTGAADELTLATMATGRTLGVGVDQLEEYAKGVIALKSAGLEGATAARAMAAAMQGNTEMLTRYLPKLRGVTDASEKQRIVNEFLSRGYEQQKQQLNTVGGQWNALKGRIGDAWEEVGRAIAQNTALTSVLKRAGDAVKAMAQRFTDWANNGGIETIKTALKDIADKIKFLIGLRYEAALIVITGATAAAAIKVALLAKNSAILSMQMNKATISLAAKAVATKAMGVASAGAAVKVLALKAAAMALSAVPWLAIAAGFIAVGKATLDMVKATHQLEASMKGLQAIEKQSLDTWGIRSPAALRKFRDAMNSGDQAMIENMEKTHPKAVAKWRELHGTVDKATDSMGKNTAANGEQKQSIADLVAEQEKQKAATKAAEEAAKKAAEAQKEYIAEVTDAVKTAMDERKDAADKLAGELDDLEKQQVEAVKDAEEAKRDEAKKTLEENQRLAKMRAGDVVAMAEEEKRIAREVAKEDEQMQRLQEDVRRGVRLGRKQAEKLAAWERIQAAKKAVDQQMEQEKVAAEHEANEKIRIEKERKMRIDEIRKELGEDAKDLGDDEIQNALDVKKREEQIVKDRVAAFIDGNKERAKVDASNADDVIENMQGVASARDHLFPESISGSVGDNIGGAVSAAEAFKNAQLNKLDEVIGAIDTQTEMLRDNLSISK